MLSFLVGLAILPFALIGLMLLITGAWYMRWVIAAVIFFAVIGLIVIIAAENKRSEAYLNGNGPKYYECIDRVNTLHSQSLQEALSNGQTSQQYTSNLERSKTVARNNCASQYPF